MTDKPNTKTWKHTRFNITTIAFPDWQINFMHRLTEEGKFISRSELIRFLVSMYHRDICRKNNESATPEQIEIINRWRQRAK